MPVINLDRTTSTVNAPSRRCAICEEYEFDSDICKNEFWMCEKCVIKLKRIMDTALWAEEYFNQ